MTPVVDETCPRGKESERRPTDDQSGRRVNDGVDIHVTDPRHHIGPIRDQERTRTCSGPCPAIPHRVFGALESCSPCASPSDSPASRLQPIVDAINDAVYG